MPQLLFHLTSDGTVDMVLGKVADDLVLAEGFKNNSPVILKFHERFPLGTVSHGPFILRFFEPNI